MKAPEMTCNTLRAIETAKGRKKNHASLGARAFIFLIAVYRRWVSPLFPPVCRFAPTCSEYAIEVLRTHGLFAGGWLTVQRILRCNPWNSGGYDPPPPAT